MKQQSTDKLHGVISDEDVFALRQRNEKRVKRAVRLMGRGYVCHPVNHVKRKVS